MNLSDSNTALIQSIIWVIINIIGTSCIKIEQVMDDFQLIMFFHPLVDKFSDQKRLKSLRVVYKLVERDLKADFC